MAYSSKNPHLSTTLIKDQTTGSVGTAPSGSHRLVNRNGALYMVDSSGNESPVGAAGQGELNVVANPSAAAAITGWAASNTGITVARTTTSTDLPLASVVSSAIKITPVSGTTDYVYYRWTMPAALKERKLKLEWHQRPLSGYAAGDLKVDVYTNTASDYSGAAARLALSTDSSAVTSIPNATGKFTTTFDGDASDYYEIRIYRTAGTTALNIANVIVGPGIQPQGAVVGIATRYTPTLSQLSASTNEVEYVRIGDQARFSGRIVLSSGAGTSSALTLTMPTGLTVDTSLVTTGATTSVKIGSGVWDDAGSISTIAPYFATSSTFGFQKTVPAVGTTSVRGSDLASGDVLHFNFMVPIAEWSGSGTLNVAQNDVEYASNSTTSDADDTTTFVYGPNGSEIPTITASAVNATRAKRVRFQTPIQSTDFIVLEIQGGGTGSWRPLGAVAGYQPYMRQGGISIGIGIAHVNSTDIDVLFARGGRQSDNATYASAGSNYPSASGDRWRVRKTSGGQAVSFGQVTQTGSGLVKSAGQLLGTNTNDSAATGYVGEYVENNRTSTIAVTSATYFSVDTGNSTFNDGNEVGITLTPGDWDISGSVYFDATTSAVITQPIVFIGTGKGTSTTGINTTKNMTELNVSFATSGDVAISTPVWRVSLSASTTYYLKARCSHTGGTGVNATGVIRARRMR